MGAQSGWQSGGSERRRASAATDAAAGRRLVSRGGELETLRTLAAAGADAASVHGVDVGESVDTERCSGSGSVLFRTNSGSTSQTETR